MKKYIMYMTPEEIIKRLNDGEIIKGDNTDKYFKMINGQICHLGKLYCVIGTKVRTDKQYYFETEEPFLLEVDRFYKTKSGKKAYIYDQNGKYSFGVVLEHGSCSWHNDTKKVCYEKGDDSLKLIGKWED